MSISNPYEPFPSSGSDSDGRRMFHKHAPPSIPDHHLMRCIGAGSYGEVWLARSSMGAFRAIKIVHRDSFDDIRPFERELSGIEKFEPLSRSHEGLVDILHVGRNDEAGYFYYVMEIGDDVIRGQDIEPATYSPRTLGKDISLYGRLSVKECLRLGLALTDALEQLHRHDLVHRDVKPSNIIFVHGVPKLADIGLVAMTSQARSYVGTEGFIPPEGPGTVQADVYGLGKVLYEASTRRDRNDFPKLPDGFKHFADLDRFLELNEVLLDACRVEPKERYESAWDLHNHLLLVSHGKSVKRLRLLERRFAAAKRAFGIIGTALICVGILGYGVYRDLRAREDQRLQEIGKDIGYGNSALQSGDLLGSLPDYVAAFQLEQANPKSAPTDRVRIGAILDQSPKLTSMWQEPQEAQFGDFSPDGTRAVVAFYNGRAQLYGLQGSHSDLSAFGQSKWVRCASFSPDGNRVATASEDGSACIWNTATLKLYRRFTRPRHVVSVRFSPDGRDLLTAGNDGCACVWDLEHGNEKITVRHTAGLRYAEFSHNGKFILTASEDETAKLWTADGKLLRTFEHPSWVYYASFSPDDERIVTACADHIARVWDLLGNRYYPDLYHDDAVQSAEYSPDGRLIVTASIDRNARLWDARSLLPLSSNSIIRTGERLSHASFSPDARRILLTGLGGTVEIWDFAGCSRGIEAGACVFSADKTRIANRVGNLIEVSDCANGHVFGNGIAVTGHLDSFELNRNGNFAVIYGHDGGPSMKHYGEVWNTHTAEVAGPRVPLPDRLSRIMVADDGKKTASWDDSVIHLFDTATLAPIFRPLTNSERVTSACFDASDERLLVRGKKTVSLWSMLTGQRLCNPFSLPVSIPYAEFSHDGKWIVACDRDDLFTKCDACVWDTKTGQLVGAPLRHEDGVMAVCFSPDDNFVAAATENFTATVWNWRTGIQIIPNVRHRSVVCSVAYNSDGKWFATGSRDETARVWNAKTGDPLTPSLCAPFIVRGLIFTRSDSELVGTDNAGRSISWRLTPDERPIGDLLEISRILFGGDLNQSGRGNLRSNKSLSSEWREMRDKYPSSFAVSSNEVTQWHEAVLKESLLIGDSNTAAFHRKFLPSPVPK